MIQGEKKQILNNLLDTTKKCQEKYNNKKELATQNDDLTLKLCNLLEDALVHGLSTHKSISDFSDLFKNVQDIVSGNSNLTFWDFCKNHLSRHERERFENLENVTTKDGRMRALIRAALNEHSLERYLSMWLSDPNLDQIYETEALMRDCEATKCLLNVVKELTSILFAIKIDCQNLNIGKSIIAEEPIIFAPTPAPTSSTKQAYAIERDILSLEEDIDVLDAVKILDSIERMENQNTVLECLVKNTENNIENTELKVDQICNDNGTISNVNKTIEIKEYLNSLGGKMFYENDLSDKEYLESETSSSTSLSKSTSISAMNASNISYTSSSIVSETHINEAEKIKFLEEQLRIMTERCKILENRVAELSLENHRLQKFKNYIDNDFGNYTITIPKVNLVKQRTSKHYIYEINITSREHETWSISKRYSDFYKLHQEMLKKHNHLIKALDFPPKKKLGNLDASFVEERRQRLQMYLRSLLKTLPEISLCTSKEELEAVLNFFK